MKYNIKNTKEKCNCEANNLICYGTKNITSIKYFISR